MTELQARPTLYKGIQMRSRLEAGYAMWLDEMGFTWSYEPHCFASRSGQYLPDFRLEDVQFGRRRWVVYVETKPTAVACVDQRPRMRIIHDAVGEHEDHQGCPYLLLIQTPERSVVQHPYWDETWHRCHWSDPFNKEVPSLAIDGNQPWQGEWWNKTTEPPIDPIELVAEPQPTGGRARLGSALLEAFPGSELADANVWPKGTKELADLLTNLGVSENASSLRVDQVLKVHGFNRAWKLITAAQRYRRDFF